MRIFLDKRKNGEIYAMVKYTKKEIKAGFVDFTHKTMESVLYYALRQEVLINGELD